ncbi:MAG: rRNA maturation RNase YbeY [Anaerolineales bacterium]
MIHVQAQSEPPSVAPDLIRAAAEAALAHLRATGELTVVLAGDTQLRALNRRYLGIDAATDVLAFPAEQPDPESGARYLGDILISVHRARVQARRAGHPLEAEVQLLVVHGVLHLLGHDHAEAPAKSRMWSAQTEVLRSLGLQDIVVDDT